MKGPIARPESDGAFPLVPLSSRAFTLLELLVVVAIIALLTALVMSGLSAARSNALRANCTSNLRQFGLALTAYAGDYGGQLPQVIGPAPGLGTIGTMAPSLQGWGELANGATEDDICAEGLLYRLSYVRSAEILYCADPPVPPLGKLNATSPHGVQTVWQNPRASPQTFTFIGYQTRYSAGVGEPLTLRFWTDKPLAQCLQLDNAFDGKGRWYFAHDGRGNNQLYGDGRVVWKRIAFNKSDPHGDYQINLTFPNPEWEITVDGAIYRRWKYGDQ